MNEYISKSEDKVKKEDDPKIEDNPENEDDKPKSKYGTNFWPKLFLSLHLLGLLYSKLPAWA